MRKTLLFCLFLSIGYAHFENKSYVGVETKAYPNSKKKSYNLALTLQNQSKYSNDYFNIYSRVDGLYDFKDEKRRQLLLNEFYLLKSYENIDFTIGKQIIFLGSLEGYNVTNFLNPQDYKKDMFKIHKKGSLISSLKYFFKDDSNLALYVKDSQKKINFPSKKYEYYPFEEYEYNKKITYKNKNTPDIMATYSFSLSKDAYSGDFTFGFYKGQDPHKVFSLKEDTYNALGFRSEKIFSYDTLMIKNWLLKFEGIYTKTNSPQVKKKFHEVGLGAEYSIENFYNSYTLGMIAEYYTNNTPLSSFDKEIFLALRCSLNDKDSSEFLLGFMKDIKESNRGLYLKYEGRVFENIKLSSDIRYAKTKNQDTVKLGIELKYYF